MLKKTIVSMLISIMLFISLRILSNSVLIIEMKDAKYDITISVIIIIFAIALYRFNRKFNLKYFDLIPHSYFIRKNLNLRDKTLIVIIAYLVDLFLTNSLKGLQDLNIINNQIKLEYLYRKQSVWENIIDYALVPSVLEEFIYRGVIYIILLTVISYIFKNKKENDVIIRRLSIICFITVSSIIFGYIHVRAYIEIGEYQYLLPYMITGIIYCLVYVWTKNISVVISLHFLNNTINILKIKMNEKFMEDIYTVVLLTTFILIGLKILKYRDYSKYEDKK